MHRQPVFNALKKGQKIVYNSGRIPNCSFKAFPGVLVPTLHDISLRRFASFNRGEGPGPSATSKQQDASGSAIDKDMPKLISPNSEEEKELRKAELQRYHLNKVKRVQFYALTGLSMEFSSAIVTAALDVPSLLHVAPGYFLTIPLAITMAEACISRNRYYHYPMTLANKQAIFYTGRVMQGMSIASLYLAAVTYSATALIHPFPIDSFIIPSIAYTFISGSAVYAYGQSDNVWEDSRKNYRILSNLAFPFLLAYETVQHGFWMVGLPMALMDTFLVLAPVYFLYDISRLFFDKHDPQMAIQRFHPMNRSRTLIFYPTLWLIMFMIALVMNDYVPTERQEKKLFWQEIIETQSNYVYNLLNPTNANQAMMVADDRSGRPRDAQAYQPESHERMIKEQLEHQT